MSTSPVATQNPLGDLDDWDDFLEGRYKEGKTEEEFRVYDATATPGVAEFYRLNHENMTVDLRSRKRGSVLLAPEGTEDHLGGRRLPQHASRRQ